jgi:histone H3/H4
MLLNKQAQQTLTQSVSNLTVKKTAALSEPAARKTISHADVTVLIAIRPDSKEWQTVLKKATRP